MKRASQILIAICLPLLLCAPARAQHIGPYAGAFIGGTALMDAKGSDDQGDFSLTFNPALQGGGVLGWDFEAGSPVGEGRIELEYTRRNNRLDKMKFVEGNFAGSGAVTADSLLLNVFGVFHDGGRWAPYLGGGIGVARIEASDLKVSGAPMVCALTCIFTVSLGATLFTSK